MRMRHRYAEVGNGLARRLMGPMNYDSPWDVLTITSCNVSSDIFNCNRSVWSDLREEGNCIARHRSFKLAALLSRLVDRRCNFVTGRANVVPIVQLE